MTSINKLTNKTLNSVIQKGTDQIIKAIIDILFYIFQKLEEKLYMFNKYLEDF